MISKADDMFKDYSLLPYGFWSVVEDAPALQDVFLDIANTGVDIVNPLKIKTITNKLHEVSEEHDTHFREIPTNFRSITPTICVNDANSNFKSP